MCILQRRCLQIQTTSSNEYEYGLGCMGQDFLWSCTVFRWTNRLKFLWLYNWPLIWLQKVDLTFKGGFLPKKINSKRGSSKGLTTALLLYIIFILFCNFIILLYYISNKKFQNLLYYLIFEYYNSKFFKIISLQFKTIKIHFKLFSQ